MSAQAPLLVELRTEELPPALLDMLARDFAERLHEGLRAESFCPQAAPAAAPQSAIDPTPSEAVAEGLAAEGRRSFATPRRLVAVVDAVAERSAVSETVRRGPRMEAAYGKDGRPTKALEGFLRSAGAEEGDVTEAEHKGARYAAVAVEKGGETLDGRVGGIVEDAVSGMSAPRMMRWGSGELRFARPIHGVMVLHGERAVEAEVLGIKADGHTVGHRFLSPGKVKVKGADSYVAEMAKRNVMADPGDRNNAIAEQATELDSGVDMDETLLAETAAMVEWPRCYLCGFEKKYLELPELALIGCMEKHLRCFPVYGAKGLLPRFVYVADNEPSSRELLVRGVERVMKARLDDALYIHGLDREMDEEALLGELDRIGYVRGFGTMRDHCGRVAAIVPAVAEALGLKAEQAKIAARAAELCKADLGTLMVAEYPELEGYIAAEYLTEEPDEVRDLVRDLPRRELDGEEGDPARDCLVVASEAERIVGLGRLLGLPTSSSDPMALRRSLARVLRVLARCEGADLGAVVSAAYSAFAAFAKKGGVDKELAGRFAKKDAPGFAREVKWLALRRLAQQRAELLGLDAFPESRTIHAVLGLWADDLGGGDALPFDVAEMAARLKAVHEFSERRPRDYESLLAASKRLTNISGHPHGRGDAKRAASETKEGAALLKGCEKVESLPDGKGPASFCDRALRELAGMQPAVDAMFDGVRILDGAGKDNHNLALVKRANELFETAVCKTSSLYKGADWLESEGAR